MHIALIAGTLMDDNRPGLNPSLDYPGWQNFELAPAQHFALQVTCDRDATGGYAGVYIGRFGDEKRPGAFNRAVYLAFNPEIIWSFVGAAKVRIAVNEALSPATRPR